MMQQEKKLKLAFVVQRYGEKVNGGAELLCRMYAEKLKDIYDITVITTCAEDYLTWKNKYAIGREVINGVQVLRFKSVPPTESFDDLNEKVHRDKNNSELGEKWMRAQGPWSPDLINYIRANGTIYDRFVFFTYLYATTYFGVKEVPAEKIILVPTLHDEPAAYLKIFEGIFHKVKKIICLTHEEKDFLLRRFPETEAEINVCGIGMEFPPRYLADTEAFKKKHRLRNYILYMGRVDYSKSCHRLFDYFERFKKRHTGVDEKLLLVGKNAINIPKSKDIVHLGFLSEQEKFDALLGASVVVNPSRYESLSMLTLEAFLCKKPVLVNGESAVLKAHCVKSNGGLWYGNYHEFDEALSLILNDDTLRRALGENGFSYLKERYSWERVLECLSINFRNKL